MSGDCARSGAPARCRRCPVGDGLLASRGQRRRDRRDRNSRQSRPATHARRIRDRSWDQGRQRLGDHDRGVESLIARPSGGKGRRTFKSGLQPFLSPLGASGLRSRVSWKLEISPVALRSSGSQAPRRGPSSCSALRCERPSWRRNKVVRHANASRARQRRPGHEHLGDVDQINQLTGARRFEAHAKDGCL
jgi:hypothetical protein